MTVNPLANNDDALLSLSTLPRNARRLLHAAITLAATPPETRIHPEMVYIAWYGDGAFGRPALCRTRRAYNAAIKRLIDTRLIAFCCPNLYWLNPCLMPLTARLRAEAANSEFKIAV